MLRLGLSLKRLMPTKAVWNGLRVHQPSHTASMASATPSSILVTNSSVKIPFIPDKMSVASHDFVLNKPHLYDRLENQEIIDQHTCKTPSVFSFSDYHLCLEHEVGDFDLIPEDVQLKIRDFSEKTFIPDVLDYLGTKHPIFRKYSAYQVEVHGFEYEFGMLKGFITNEERYDLSELERLLTLPCDEFPKIAGKRLLGSAIRICKTIGKPQHADALSQIVKGYFIPHTQQDPKDSIRSLFDLHVEPSTGGIQCNCCEE